MWEIPIYLIIAPLFTLVITLICSIKFERYRLGPLLVLLIFNIPTIVLPLIYNVGWSAMFGWAAFYTLVAVIISASVWLVKRNAKKTNPA